MALFLASGLFGATLPPTSTETAGGNSVPLVRSPAYRRRAV